MKNISAVIHLGPATPAGGADKEVNQIFKGERRLLLEIKLQNSAVLSKHRAGEPITVFCIAGAGRFSRVKNWKKVRKCDPARWSRSKPMCCTR